MNNQSWRCDGMTYGPWPKQRTWIVGSEPDTESKGWMMKVFWSDGAVSWHYSRDAFDSTRCVSYAREIQ